MAKQKPVAPVDETVDVPTPTPNADKTPLTIDDLTGFKVEQRPFHVDGIVDPYWHEGSAAGVMTVYRKSDDDHPGEPEQITPPAPETTPPADQTTPAQEPGSADKPFLDWVETIARQETREAKIDGKVEHYNVWVTKFDGGYLGSRLDDFRWWFDEGITEQLQKRSPDIDTANIGFNPTNQKWYGWSKYGFASFGIGDTVELNTIGFEPSSEEEFRQVQQKEYTEDHRIEVRSNGPVQMGDQYGVVTTWITPGPDTNGLVYQRGQAFDEYPQVWGRGEWTAETLEDAKLMAQNFTAAAR